MIDTSNLKGKIRYAQEQMAPEWRDDPVSVTLEVWRLFYRDIKFRFLGGDRIEGRLYDIAELPNIREVSAAMKRMEPKSKPADDMPVPWYANVS